MRHFCGTVIDERGREHNVRVYGFTAAGDRESRMPLTVGNALVPDFAGGMREVNIVMLPNGTWRILK